MSEHLGGDDSLEPWMNAERLVELPTAQQLEKLPLRAIVAYAGRCAKRRTEVLRDLFPNDVIEDALRAIDSLVTREYIDSAHEQVALMAAASIAGASSELRSKSKDVTLAALALVFAAHTCGLAIAAASDPKRAAFFPESIP